MLLKSFLSIITLSLVANVANATVISFEETPQSSGSTPSSQGDIVSNGYLFDSSTNHTHFVNNYSGGDSGSTFFGADNFAGVSTVTMTEATNSIFSLASLDLGNWFETSTNLLITGNLAGGGSIFTNIALGSFATYNLGWNNLASVVFNSTSGSGDQYWGVDNINVTANVPAPSTITLLSLGLFGISLARRKKS